MKKTLKTKDTSAALPAAEADDVLAELQELWDRQESRVAELAARAEAQPLRLNLAGGGHSHNPVAAVRNFVCTATRRRCGMAEYLVLLAVNLCMGAAVLLSFLPVPDATLRLAGFVFLAVNGLMALHCLTAIVALRPGRGSLRRHSHAAMAAGAALRHVAVVSAAVVVVSVAVSCTPTGDGYAMTGFDGAARAATVDGVTNVIRKI